MDRKSARVHSKKGKEPATTSHVSVSVLGGGDEANTATLDISDPGNNGVTNVSTTGSENSTRCLTNNT